MGESPREDATESDLAALSAAGEEISEPIQGFVAKVASATASTSDVAVNDAVEDRSSQRGEDILPAIARLRQEQRRLREERKAVAKALKNAEKRRTRLKRRACKLTDEDLMTVMKMRSEERGADAVVPAAASASSSSQPSARRMKAPSLATTTKAKAA